MSTQTAEDQVEYKQSLSLLSHTELVAMKGDNEEEDALIDQILAEGKAVVSLPKGQALAADNPDRKPNKLPGATDDDDGDEEEEEEEDATAAAAAAKKAAEAPAAPAAAAAVAAAAEAEAQAAAAAAAAAVAPAVEVPKLDLGFVDTKYSDKMAALDAEKAGKFQQLMDGTIDASEFSKYESGYMASRDLLRDEKQDEKIWFAHVHTFKSDVAKTIGLNYYADPAAGEALNDWIVRLASKPENAEKSSEWFLQEAHKKVLTELDFKPAGAKQPAAAAAAVAADPAAAAKPAATPGRAPKLDNLPPTLSGLPAAATAGHDDGGEFAHLANLEGMAYERALAAMTPEQKDRYERA